MSEGDEWTIIEGIIKDAYLLTNNQHPSTAEVMNAYDRFISKPC